MKKYKYILFDNDGTLMDFAQAEARALEISYNNSPLSALLPYSPFIFESYERCNKAWWKKLEKGECTKAELQYGRFADFFEAIGLIGDADAFNSDYMESLGKGQDLLPGAAEICRVLSERYDIYIITNGVAVTQHRRIDSCGYVKYIKGMFVSEETGFAKPKKEYFDYVLSAIGAKSEECIVIGDTLSSDILGANNAGIDCIWYNPTKEALPEGFKVTFEVDSLEKIAEIL